MHAKSQVSLIRAEDGRCRSSHAHQHVVITPIALGAAPRADVVADGSMICGPVDRHCGLAEIIQVLDSKVANTENFRGKAEPHQGSLLICSPICGDTMPTLKNRIGLPTLAKGSVPR